MIRLWQTSTSLKELPSWMPMGHLSPMTYCPWWRKLSLTKRWAKNKTLERSLPYRDNKNDHGVPGMFLFNLHGGHSN